MKQLVDPDMMRGEAASMEVIPILVHGEPVSKTYAIACHLALSVSVVDMSLVPGSRLAHMEYAVLCRWLTGEDVDSLCQCRCCVCRRFVSDCDLMHCVVTPVALV